MEWRVKQVIAVRSDLKMGKGKLAAQVAHGAVAGMEETRRRQPEWVEEWLQEGQPKIVVRVGGLDELLALKVEAEEADIPLALVQDRGLTQLPPGTITCLALGPAPSDRLDPITGRLKLL